MELLSQEWKVMGSHADYVVLEGSCERCFSMLHLTLAREFIFEGKTSLTFKCNYCGNITDIKRISGSLGKSISCA